MEEGRGGREWGGGITGFEGVEKAHGGFFFLRKRGGEGWGFVWVGLGLIDGGRMGE